MRKLVTVQLKIPGRWRDAWLYKNKCYLWDREGRLHYFDMTNAGRKLSSGYGAAKSLIAQSLIFRNDWKVGEQFRHMMHNPDIEAGFLRPFGDKDALLLELPDNLLEENDSEPYTGAVLDTNIYANRVYLGTRDGLLESYVSPNFPDRYHPLHRQLEGRISKLAIRYAAINASAEEEGLHFGRVILPNENDEYPGFIPFNFSRVADYSIAVSHAARHILNYTGGPVPSLYRAKVEEKSPHPKARFDEHQVVGYHDKSDLYELTQRTLLSTTADIGKSRAQDAEIEVLGNSSHLLLASINDRLRVLNLRAFDNEEVAVRRNPQYRGLESSRINATDTLEVYSINGGFVVELDESVQLVNKDGSYNLLNGAAARVRTFSSSLRHKEAIAVIQEESASLVGYYAAEGALF